MLEQKIVYTAAALLLAFVMQHGGEAEPDDPLDMGDVELSSPAEPKPKLESSNDDLQKISQDLAAIRQDINAIRQIAIEYSTPKASTQAPVTADKKGIGVQSLPAGAVIESISGVAVQAWTPQDVALAAPPIVSSPSSLGSDGNGCTGGNVSSVQPSFAQPIAVPLSSQVYEQPVVQSQPFVMPEQAPAVVLSTPSLEPQVMAEPIYEPATVATYQETVVAPVMASQCPDGQCDITPAASAPVQSSTRPTLRSGGVLRSRARRIFGR